MQRLAVIFALVLHLGPAVAQEQPSANWGLVFDAAMGDHDTGAKHPESAQRLQWIKAGLEAAQLWDSAVPIPARAVEDRWLLAVHSQAHLDGITAAVASGATEINGGEVQLSPRSLDAARLAAGGVLAACDAIMKGDIHRAFAVVRPPGHHAEREKAMGFCLFNNVAVAARYLQQHHGLERIMIIDWDVHFGNGTYDIFKADPSVFQFHIHQNPLTMYPGTGFAFQRGEGAGEGFTKNIPLDPGSGDAEVLAILRTELVAAAAEFQPQFILISAGFDLHRDDPLGQCTVTSEGFGEMTRIVRALADTHCEGRLLSVLEGGYSQTALTDGVAAHVKALAE